MCRVSLFNKKGFQYIDSVYGAERFFDYLEKECGGSGNGIALVKNEKLIFTQKGVKYSNKEIYQKLVSTDFDYCMYHTRIPSVGSRTDANCHPFKKGNIVLAMNGTESGFKGVADMLNITDTEAVLRTAVAFTKNIVEVCSKVCTSTFVGFDNGKPFVTAHKDFFSGIQFVVKDDIIIFASTLPREFKDRQRPKTTPFVWTEGTKVEGISVYDYQNVRGYGSFNSRGYYQDMFESGWDNVKSTKKEENVKLTTEKKEKKEEKKEKKIESQRIRQEQSRDIPQRYLGNGVWEDDPDYTGLNDDEPYVMPYWMKYVKV